MYCNLFPLHTMLLLEVENFFNTGHHWLANFKKKNSYKRVLNIVAFELQGVKGIFDAEDFVILLPVASVTDVYWLPVSSVTDVYWLPV